MSDLSARIEQKIQAHLEAAIDTDLDIHELERLEKRITTIRKLAAPE